MNAMAERSTAVSRLLVLGVVAALALSACSSGGAPSASASAGAGDGGPTAAPQTASTGTAGISAGAIDVCAVVTAADVASLFSGPAGATTEPGLVGGASGCSYASNQTDEGFTIEVVTGDQAAAYWSGNTPPQGQDDTIPLTGIGDKAMRAAGAADFVSLKGSIFCEAEVGSEDPDTFTGLATPDASDNVPDDSATAFAEKIGQLCNKIFASAGG